MLTTRGASTAVRFGEEFQLSFGGVVVLRVARMAPVRHQGDD
jgi:hypothetical protein